MAITSSWTNFLTATLLIPKLKIISRKTTVLTQSKNKIISKVKVYPVLQNSHLAYIELCDSKLETNEEHLFSKRMYDVSCHLKKTLSFVCIIRIVQVFFSTGENILV